MKEKDELFMKEMADVDPLKGYALKPIKNRPLISDIDFSERRNSATKNIVGGENFLVSEGIAPLDAFYILGFKREGIQNGVYRKLKQGRYDYDAKLDLHRMSVKQARKEIFVFVQEASVLGLRMLLLIHGKGRAISLENRKSILKGYTNAWLQQLPVVQAFHSAQNKDGGTGAVYILLRKSEENKRLNRARYRDTSLDFPP